MGHDVHNCWSRVQERERRIGPSPPQLIVDVEATAYRCEGMTERPLTPDYGSGLLSMLSFQLNWKDGSEMRTVDIVSSEMRHVRLGVRWNYFLKIPAKDVPLSHRVVIDVFTRDRIALGRLSAGVG